MEFYTHKRFENDKDPDKTGETSTSKNKKKRRHHLPLPVETEPAKDSEKPKRQPKKSPESLEPKPSESQEELSEDKETATDAGLELPEVEQSIEDETPFLGELVVDHSNEDIPPVESIDTLEALPEQATDVNTELSLPTGENFENPPIYGDEIEPSPILAQEDSEEPPKSPVESVPLSPGFMPENVSLGHMLNPSEWRSRSFTEAPLITNEPDMVPATEAHRRAYRAEKRGLSRGVVSGALAGWWLARRKGYRQAERVQTSQSYDRPKAIGRLEAEHASLERATQKRESTLQRNINQLRNLVERNWDTHVFGRRETISSSKDTLTGNRNVAKSTTPENTPQVNYEHAVPPVEQPSLPIEERQVTEGMLQAPEGHRFETSAWHRIEVDEKTGRLVEQPAFEYGEAFHQEQQQERLAHHPVQAQAIAQLATAPYSAGTQASANAAPEPIIAQAVQAPKQPLITPSDVLYVKQQMVYRTTSPVTWGIALTILVLLVVTGVV